MGGEQRDRALIALAGRHGQHRARRVPQVLEHGQGPGKQRLARAAGPAAIFAAVALQDLLDPGGICAGGQNRHRLAGTDA